MRAAGVATPIIVMTALTDDGIPAQVHALGERTAFLRKPFELSELESAISTLLPARNS